MKVNFIWGFVFVVLAACANDKPKESEGLPPAEPFTFTDGPMAEEMVAKKVVLGRFEVKKGKISLKPTDPDWPNIDRHNLTVDDHGRIYVLNLRNAEVMVFDDEGKVLNRIPLPVEKYMVTSRQGYLEVNGSGERLLVQTPDIGRSAASPDYVKSRQFIIDQNGEMLKEFQQNFSFPDKRFCNKTYVFLQGPYIYDENFTRIDDKKFKFEDSEGAYEYGRGKKKLVKRSQTGQVIWVKQSHGYFSIHGLDQQNNLYLTGYLQKGEPSSLYKLNGKGTVLSHVPMVPDPFPSLTKEEEQHWKFRASEELFSMFKLACNGDVYLIYQLGELPALTLNRWMEKGEYFIYKFESKKKPGPKQNN